MTSYLDIDTSPEAIHEDEEIIEAMEMISSKVAEAIITDVKNDVSNVAERAKNIFDRIFPFAEAWRNDHDVFWTDIQHLTIAAVLFVVFFVLLAPWQSQKIRRTSSWMRLQQALNINNKDGRRENKKQSDGSGRWWKFSRRIASRTNLKAQTSSPWNPFFVSRPPYSLERSKSASNILTGRTATQPSTFTNGYGEAMEAEESEEEEFAKRWPYILETPYRCLVLPPGCKRVEKPKNANRPPNTSTAAKQSGSVTDPAQELKTNNIDGDNGEGADTDENPATRLLNYIKHFFHLIMLFRRYDFAAAGWMLIHWVQAALRARKFSREGSHGPADEDEDEDESVASSSVQSTTMDLPARGKGATNAMGNVQQSSKKGDDTPLLTNRIIKVSPRVPVRSKKEKSTRMQDAPPMPPIYCASVPNEEDVDESERISKTNDRTDSIVPNSETFVEHTGHGSYDVSDSSIAHNPSNGGGKHKLEEHELEKGVLLNGDDETLTNTQPRAPLVATSPTYHTPLCDLKQVDQNKALLVSSSTKIPSLGTTGKARDALENYRVSSLRRMDLSTPTFHAGNSTSDKSKAENVCPSEPPRRSMTKEGSSRSSKFFFETATTRESLIRMNVEVPVPDRNGYIVGDEFLPDNTFSPLLAFVNSRSGPQQGHLLIAQLRGLLNPIQVWDLADGGPKEILESFSVFSRLRILVCGGDGTVSWIVSTIEKMELQRWPPIAILPLGTGNDLARILGWGGGYNSESLTGILQQVAESYISWLDRWEMTIESKKGKVKQVKSFFNYLGVGADAQAALQVHMLRESRPQLFFNRLINKAWYGIFGAEDIIKATSVNLPYDITLIADGVEVPLPADSQGIILLNIDSYAGGVALWSKGHKAADGEAPYLGQNLSRPIRMKRSKSLDALKEMRVDSSEDLASLCLTEEEKYHHVTACEQPSSCQDGLLDIVSIRGAFHLGQIRVGLSTAQKLCQCREATIIIRRKVSVQIDGEPWRQTVSTLHVRRKKDAAIMLHRSAGESNGAESEMAKLLDWGEDRGLITTKVHAALMKEFSRRIESKTRQRRDKSNENLMVSLKRAIKAGNTPATRQSTSYGNFHQNHAALGGAQTGLIF